METIKWVECVVVNDRKYRLEGLGEDMRDGSFQSVCDIVTTQGDSPFTKRLTFQIWSGNQDFAAEVALRCGVGAVQKRTYAIT